MSRRLVACRYPSADLAVLSWERLSEHFAGERCEDDIPELIAERLYACAARNAAALARDGHSGTFSTRRPEGSRLVFDSAGGYGPERRLYG
jgi:hypothetical protein